MISYCVDGSHFRNVAGYVAMMTELDCIADRDVVRLSGLIIWPGFWAFESKPAVHGNLPGIDMPAITCNLLHRHDRFLPDTVEILQGCGEKPILMALPLGSDGVQMPHLLIETLPPHVAEDLGRRISAVNDRMADEVRALERPSRVPMTEGEGDGGGVMNVNLPGLDGFRG